MHPVQYVDLINANGMIPFQYVVPTNVNGLINLNL